MCRSHKNVCLIRKRFLCVCRMFLFLVCWSELWYYYTSWSVAQNRCDLWLQNLEWRPCMDGCYFYWLLPFACYWGWKFFSFDKFWRILTPRRGEKNCPNNYSVTVYCRYFKRRLAQPFGQIIFLNCTFYMHRFNFNQSLNLIVIVSIRSTLLYNLFPHYYRPTQLCSVSVVR